MALSTSSRHLQLIRQINFNLPISKYFPANYVVFDSSLFKDQHIIFKTIRIVRNNFTEKSNQELRIFYAASVLRKVKDKSSHS